MAEIENQGMPQGNSLLIPRGRLCQVIKKLFIQRKSRVKGPANLFPLLLSVLAVETERSDTCTRHGFPFCTSLVS